MAFSAGTLPDKTGHRHVVFADSSRPRRAVINFGPAIIADRPATSSLSVAEQAFVNWLFNRCGLSAAAYREETLIRRLPACLRLIRAATVQEAQSAIESQPSLAYSAIGTLVIGVTSFFRDAQVFRALSERIIPALTSSGNPLRAWSVGCSDGQELYSLAMLLAEAGWLHRSNLLGTDCRVDAVRRASAGLYEDREVRSVPDSMLHHFHRASKGWSIDPRVRTVVQWRTADALQMIEPGKWDILFCRNFAMYLEPRESAMLWKRLFMSLSPGGFLIVGKAERPGINGCYSIAPCIFRKCRN